MRRSIALTFDPGEPDHFKCLPVIVKGITSSEDTAAAVKYGMSGVIVSNHGARQLDQVGGTIEALPECVEAANGRIPVLIDGGFRRGTDHFKYLPKNSALA